MDEDVSLAVDHVVLGIGCLFSQHHVLQGSQRFSDLLGVVSLFVGFASVLALVGVGVVLSSLLDLVLRPFLVLVDQENLLDFTDLVLDISGELG